MLCPLPHIPKQTFGHPQSDVTWSGGTWKEAYVGSGSGLGDSEAGDTQLRGAQHTERVVNTASSQWQDYPFVLNSVLLEYFTSSRTVSIFPWLPNSTAPVGGTRMIAE